MKNSFRDNLLDELQQRYGKIQRVGNGHSLFRVLSADFFVYFRYSKLANAAKSKQTTFYGIRKEDLDLMQTKKSFICFLTDDDSKNVTLPFRQFEGYFSGLSPASDGQYKAALTFKPIGTELYVNNVGKFNMENHLGVGELFNMDDQGIAVPVLSHTQVQSLVGSIGIKKGFDVWFPRNDKESIDDTVVNFANVRESLPCYGKDIDRIISEIDVIWFDKATPVSFYEVEHSTPIYSGLLRFNDVLLTVPNAENFNVIADDDRESKFGREINRPTFKQNRLIDKVTFLDYATIYRWHSSLCKKDASRSKQKELIE